ncbi:MAG: hypothetical protein U1E65_13535 [Myxococcota bacterium]
MGATFPVPAFADGKRDLDDGIAFYENLDTDRAIERLKSAAEAKDLGPADRSKAQMYLGIVQFEVGKEFEADTAWKRAFALDPKIAAPSGTSPKVLAAIEKARAKGGGSSAEVTPVSPSPKPSPSPSLKPSPTPSPSPDLTPAIDATPAVVPPEEKKDEGGGSGWLIWGGIGLGVAAAAAVTIILVATSGGPCASGGCASVRVQ